MDKQNRVLDLFKRSSYSVLATTYDVSDPSIAKEPAILLLPSNIGILPKHQLFSVFNKQQMEEATIVYNFLISLKSIDDFFKVASNLKEKLNGGLYLYALAVALVHRDDTREVYLPPLWQVSPYTFIQSSAVHHALDIARTPGPTSDTVEAVPIVPSDTTSDTEVPSFVTGTVRDPEQKVAWWREDIGMNSHHTHWHQVYPWAGVEGKTKDREGELFYYMHHQMLARYDAERIAVGLMQVVPYEIRKCKIDEGYDSHLTDYYGRKQYTPRPSGMILADNFIDPINPTLVSTQAYNYNRLLDAVISGNFEMPDGSKQPVDIVSLGAAVESSISSPNLNLYGSVHNTGHDLSSVITDPDGRYNQSMGVMGDPATSNRDPFFFRWHKLIDNLFVQHKNTLTPYTEEELSFTNVTLTDVSIRDCIEKINNELTTRMETTPIDISESMFFSTPEENSSVMVNVTRENHNEFEYDIAVHATKAVKAAFRIFIAPQLDEHGQPMKLKTQRRLFIEMDKFVQDLSPGDNRIQRSSLKSSVIKPPSKTFHEIRNAKDTDGCSCRERYCECGWPHNLLLPRGTATGMKFDLFVMVTDWVRDKVKLQGRTDLDQGTSYCGIKNKKYPDSRAMGFPFDRVIGKFETGLKKGQTPSTVDELTNHYGNMLIVTNRYGKMLNKMLNVPTGITITFKN